MYDNCHGERSKIPNDPAECCRRVQARDVTFKCEWSIVSTMHVHPSRTATSPVRLLGPRLRAHENLLECAASYAIIFGVRCHTSTGVPCWRDKLRQPH